MTMAFTFLYPHFAGNIKYENVKGKKFQEKQHGGLIIIISVSQARQPYCRRSLTYNGELA